MRQHMTERIHNVDALWIPHPLDMLNLNFLSAIVLFTAVKI